MFKIFNIRSEVLFILFLLIASSFLRITQLGYSSFYGDETKVLYLRKDIGAKDFLLNQRKGPTQYLVAWGTEKIYGSYDEFYTRIPFAILGIVSVIIIYFLTKDLFNMQSAVIASLLFCFNGLFIGFSRTIQYQSILIFFSLLAIYCVYQFTHKQKSRLYLFGASIFTSVSFLSHWDSIFFFIPQLVFLISYISNDNAVYKTKTKIYQIILYFLLPITILCSIFYIPYVTHGYFNNYFFNYIFRRTLGIEQLSNNSFITTFIYNPNLLYFLTFIALFIVIFFTKQAKKLIVSTLFTWFISAFFVYEYGISNPGTHIYVYLLPMILLCSYGISLIYDCCKLKIHSYILQSLFAVYVLTLFIYSSFVFIPYLNTGYPWINTTVFGFLPLRNIEKYKSNNQLFLYGFVYDRGWDQIREYFKTKSIHNFYTNDNVTVGEYYLLGVPATPIAHEQLPEYYINVYDNQEFNPTNTIVSQRYILEKRIFVSDKLSAEIFKLRN